MMNYMVDLIEIIVKFLKSAFYFFNQVWIFFQFTSIDKHIGTFSHVFHMLENIFADLCCYIDSSYQIGIDWNTTLF